MIKSRPPISNNRTRRSLRGGVLAIASTLSFGLVGCVTTTDATRLLTVNERVTVEGKVVSVDRTPIAYDGNAVIVIASDGYGGITVQVPARLNLCKAQGLELLGQLKPGDRIRAQGTVTGSNEVTPCQDENDRLIRVD